MSYVSNLQEWPDSQLRQQVGQENEDANGLREPGQPSEAAHELHRREMERDFSPLERRLIRNNVGLAPRPWADQDEVKG